MTQTANSTETDDGFNPWKVAFDTMRWRLGVLLVSFALIYIAPIGSISPQDAEMLFLGVLISYGAWQLDMKDIEFADEDDTSDTDSE